MNYGRKLLMKKSINAVYFCLPAVIYISCSALAFLLWNLFNQGRTPVIATSIILCIAGSLLSGFFSIGKYGKRGMYAAIGITVAAETFDCIDGRNIVCSDVDGSVFHKLFDIFGYAPFKNFSLADARGCNNMVIIHNG